MDTNSGKLTPNIGDIANAADSAKNFTTEIIDRFFPYCGLQKKALDVYISEIEKSDKPKEFKAWEVMRAKKEFKKLKNISNIVEFANEYCTDDEIKSATYSDNEEWYDRFFANAESVSDESVQRIWGRILATEIRQKGVTPRSVISILTEIDSVLAKAFSILCGHRLLLVGIDSDGNVMRDTGIVSVMIFGDDDYYIEKGLNLATLVELESIGLIKMNSSGFLRVFSDAKKVLVSDGVFTDCVKLQEEEFCVGSIMSTRAGNYIRKLISPPIVKDQHDIMLKFYKKLEYEFESTDFSAKLFDNGFFVTHER